jgi:hypothetical protein
LIVVGDIDEVDKLAILLDSSINDIVAVKTDHSMAGNPDVATDASNAGDGADFINVGFGKSALFPFGRFVGCGADKRRTVGRRRQVFRRDTAPDVNRSVIATHTDKISDEIAGAIASGKRQANGGGADSDGEAG